MHSRGGRWSCGRSLLLCAKRRVWRRACMLGCCVGREPQHAALSRAGGYIRLGNAFLSLPLEPWERGKMPTQRHCTRDRLSCRLHTRSFCASSPAEQSPFQRQRAGCSSCSHGGISASWTRCALALSLLPGACGYLWLQEYTEHCCTLECFCFRLWMTNSTSGHAGKVKKQIFQRYLIPQDQEEPLRRVGKNCWCTSTSLCKKHKSERWFFLIIKNIFQCWIPLITCLQNLAGLVLHISGEQQNSKLVRDVLESHIQLDVFWGQNPVNIISSSHCITTFWWVVIRFTLAWWIWTRKLLMYILLIFQWIL